MQLSIQRLTHSLTLRMLVPMVLITGLLGAGLYLFVLRAVSTFANRQIAHTLSTIASEIYDICDENFTTLLQSGQMSNQRAMRIQKALTVGALEDYVEKNDLGCRLAAAGGQTLLAHNIRPDLVAQMDKKLPVGSFSRIPINGKDYYFQHFTFKPWEWHIDVIKDTKEYAPLIRQVKIIYYLTGILLFMSLAVILFVVERLLHRPLNRIIRSIGRGHAPGYRGIYELEYLSDNIAGMMQRLSEQTAWIERLYHVAIDYRGKVFFERIAETIADTVGLHTLIVKTEGDESRFQPVALSGITGIGLRHSAEGLPLAEIVSEQAPLTIPTGAAERFASARCLAAARAACYIGLPLFGREGGICGIVNLFGPEKSLSDWEMNFVNTAGQMVAAEFELLDREKEQARFQEQIFQAQKLESLGLLAGGVAHDFNNLLMGIQGRTSLMLNDASATGAYREHLTEIEEYVKKATDLTGQLLGFARGGKYDVKPADMNAVLGQSARMFGRTNKDIAIDQAFAPDLWKVEIDQRQIEQVLLNLFVNAGHAMPGGGSLYLRTENTVLAKDRVRPFQIPAGRYVKISVTDTGVGMDDATRERIFDPFFTTKKMGRGTGLGLASAYGIIKNHSGLIAVHSQKGRGTTFDIYLPATDKTPAPSTAQPEAILTGSETVLLVDDEQMIVDVGQQMLEKLGYRVLTANSGKQAVSAYRRNGTRIGLVILDMVMQNMSGGETFDRLKAIDPGVRVLLSSGYSIDGQAEDILNRGCSGFIQKPFSITDLSKKLRQILDTTAG